jgi:steroid delta-isomerase-like uncharacterized protein
MTESERNLGRRWFEQVWNQGRREAIAEMLEPGTLIHDGAVESKGPEGFYAFFDRIQATLSDMKIDIHDTFAEGDKVCVQWSSTAKHTGAGLGMAPTGETVHVTGITIFRVRDEKIVEAWQNWDMLGLLEQLNKQPRAAVYIASA